MTSSPQSLPANDRPAIIILQRIFPSPFPPFFLLLTYDTRRSITKQTTANFHRDRVIIIVSVFLPSPSSGNILSTLINSFRVEVLKINMKNDHHQEFDHHQDYFFQMGSYGTATPESERPTSFSEPATSCQSPSSSADPLSPIFKTEDKGDDSKVVVQKKKKKLERKANSYVYRIREHVKLGPKFSETVKGKLSLGAKIIRKGGRENIFRQIFSVSDGEQLLKASQCYLSTTAGPIAGILFISTEKVAFCSERPVTLSACPGGVVRTPYKVSIPVRKIKKANESANVEKPAKKYIEIVTDDNFEFWFMGFVRYEKALKNLRKAISMSSSMPF